MKRHLDRTPSLVICLLGYIITFIIIFLVAPFISIDSPLLFVFILDIIATAVIFIFSVIYNNSSFYDTYWSVAPVPVMIYWVVSSDKMAVNTVRQVVILILVILWAVRLTYNWARRWQGMQDEDFRYVNFRNSAGRFYWVVSFLGIHMFPTMIVFLGCMAVYPALAYHSSPFGAVDVLATVVTLSAIVIETIADRQLRHFIKNPSGTFLQSGLWKYSRHPNYFGEVLFWVGLFLFSLTPVAPNLGAVVQWWTFPGPVAMILLFLFISVPIMDKRMLRKKEGYRAYMKKTSALVPWFRRKGNS